MHPTRIAILAGAIVVSMQPCIAVPVSLQDLLPGLTFQRPVPSALAAPRNFNLQRRCSGSGARFGTGGAISAELCSENLFEVLRNGFH